MTSQVGHSVLELMATDLASQSSLYQPTTFWSGASRDIYNELEGHGFQQFRSLPACLSFFVPTYGPPGNTLTVDEARSIKNAILSTVERGSKKAALLMHMVSGEMWALADYRVARAGDCLAKEPDLASLSESKVGDPCEHFCFEGRWFSRSFLNYITGLVFLKQHIQNVGIKRVIEVGGGFGSLGEILLQAGSYAYVDVDIPPTAAVASYYIANQAGAKLIPYAETRRADSIPFPEPGEQLVLCPWQLPRLHGQADLFINFISFQEMEPHVVQGYLQHADRLKCRFVLLRNLSEGKQRRTARGTLGVQTPILGADYDRFMPNYRLVATNVIPFGYRTLDGFNSELRLYERKICL